MPTELPVLAPSRLAHIPEDRPIDNTALDTYDKCERRYYYSMILNRRRKGHTPAPLVYGTAWHKIKETHYRTGGNMAAVEAAAIMAWEPTENPDDHRTLDRILQAYDAFLRTYGQHDEETKRWGRTVGYPENPVVEIAAEIWWDGALHPYTGKIDRIFEDQGLYYVEDHKTTSALGATFFRQFDPSNQMMGYCWIAQQLTGLRIAGVRICAHGVLKTQNKFERSTIHYSPERLEEWARNYNVRVKRIDNSHRILAEAGPEPSEAVLLEAFPHNFNACAGKYGPCSYVDVCTYASRMRSKILENDFEDNPWNPLAGEEDNG